RCVRSACGFGATGPAPPETYPLSLHDALPISSRARSAVPERSSKPMPSPVTISTRYAVSTTMAVTRPNCSLRRRISLKASIALRLRRPGRPTVNCARTALRGKGGPVQPFYVRAILHTVWQDVAMSPPRQSGPRAGWLLDELESAGRENLDAVHAARYDAKEDAAAASEVALCRDLGLTEDSVVVELGAGTGQFALAVAPHCARVVAVDVSPVMLKVLRAKLDQAPPSRVEAVQAGFLTYEH